MYPLLPPPIHYVLSFRSILELYGTIDVQRCRSINSQVSSLSFCILACFLANDYGEQFRHLALMNNPYTVDCKSLATCEQNSGKPQLIYHVRIWLSFPPQHALPLCMFKHNKSIVVFLGSACLLQDFCNLLYNISSPPVRLVQKTNKQTKIPPPPVPHPPTQFFSELPCTYLPVKWWLLHKDIHCIEQELGWIA